jgi:hypothetical protein
MKAMMRRMLLALALAAAGLATPASAQQVIDGQGTRAADRLMLRGLDTLNGSTQDLDLAVGATIRYGHLEVTAEACRVPQNDPDGDAYAFLRIRDIRESQARFAGWMFASSPALSALDHPRYDVWVLSCSSL